MRVRTVAWLNTLVGLAATALGPSIEAGFMSLNKKAHIWGPATTLLVGIVGLQQCRGEGKKLFSVKPRDKSSDISKPCFKVVAWVRDIFLGNFRISRLF